MLGLVVLLTLHTSHVRARAFRVVVAIVIIIELSTFVQAIVGREGNDGIGYVMFVLLLIAPLVILSRILRHEVVGMETILGALCVYVLLGIGFAGIFAGINDFEPRGFFAQPGPKNNVDFLYFSFVTITTVGFGDFTPGTDVGPCHRDVRGADRPGLPRDARGPARGRCTASRVAASTTRTTGN